MASKQTTRSVWPVLGGIATGALCIPGHHLLVALIAVAVFALEHLRCTRQTPVAAVRTARAQLAAKTTHGQKA